MPALASLINAGCKQMLLALCTAHYSFKWQYILKTRQLGTQVPCTLHTKATPETNYVEYQLVFLTEVPKDYV